MPTPQTPETRTQQPHRAWWRAWRHRDDGSATAEVTLVTPLLVMLLIVVGIVIHRGVDARIRIDDAAHQAARAASLERLPTAATAAARDTAVKALTSTAVACRHPQITTSTHGLQPGGTVSVTISCDVDIGDTLIPGLTATHHVTVTAHEPVDQWRSTRTAP